ncbi:MAG: hypothetical protein VX265_19070 [Myxococcota bacterium]|nr:hypothetical protein [Myxococcota bacterium]MEC8424878.1 hypothetical protein [Myxococcota bacterium]
MLLARAAAEALVFGGEPSLRAWLLPAGMLAFVIALLQVSLLARRRFDGAPDPASVRRQWWVVCAAFLLGLVGGIAFAWLGPHSA